MAVKFCSPKINRSARILYPTSGYQNTKIDAPVAFGPSNYISNGLTLFSFLELNQIKLSLVSQSIEVGDMNFVFSLSSI